MIEHLSIRQLRKKAWVYIMTEELAEALKEWTNNKPPLNNNLL